MHDGNEGLSACRRPHSMDATLRDECRVSLCIEEAFALTKVRRHSKPSASNTDFDSLRHSSSNTLIDCSAISLKYDQVSNQHALNNIRFFLSSISSVRISHLETLALSGSTLSFEGKMTRALQNAFTAPATSTTFLAVLSTCTSRK